MMVRRRAEAVQERNATEPWAGSTQRVGSSGDTRGRDQSPLDLVKEDPVLRETLWAWGCPCSAPVGSRAKRCRIGSPAVTCSPPGDFATGCSGGRLGNCS
jgi:hypothetical protein